MKMDNFLTQMKLIINRRHQFLIANAKTKMIRLKIIITVLLTLYLPGIAYLAVERVQEYDQRFNSEMARAESSHNMTVFLSSQKHIIESIDMLMRQTGLEPVESGNLLHSIDIHQKQNNNKKAVDADIIDERYKAANMVGLTFLAGGLLKLGGVLAESYDKLKCNWTFYGAILAAIGGAAAAGYSLHQLASSVG